MLYYIEKSFINEVFVITGTKKFKTITENTPTVPPSPAKLPTDGPLKISLGIVCTLPIEN